jgi:hypothetical protein
VPVKLGDGEVCHYTSPCSYAVMENVNHGSTSVGVSFRVAKGVRVGSYQKLPPVRDMRMVHEATGDLYLTNKRLLFVDYTTSQSFNWPRTLQSTPFVDGVRYEVSNHRPVQFRTGNIGAALMSTAIEELASSTRGSTGGRQLSAQ